MYILNGTRTELINTERVERFCIVEKSDACLIIASYGPDATPVTVARYQTQEEALSALLDLFSAMEGDFTYRIRENTGVYKPTFTPKNGYHGKKHSSHGGS